MQILPHPANRRLPRRASGEGNPSDGRWVSDPYPGCRRDRKEAAADPPLTVVRIVVTAGAFVLIARKIGFGAVVHALADANPAYLASGYAIAVITILLTVWQWNGLATANGVARPYRRCLHLELGGDVFDAALPSSIGGDFIRATSLAESPEERVPAAASVVLRRLCNFPGDDRHHGAWARGHPFARTTPIASALSALGVVAGGLALVVVGTQPGHGTHRTMGTAATGPGTRPWPSCSTRCTNSGVSAAPWCGQRCGALCSGPWSSPASPCSFWPWGSTSR